MIESADQFRLLRESEIADEYNRAARDSAPLNVWLEIIERMPDMRFWVAQNKTVPVEILRLLADDSDSRIRDMVARKRKLPESIQVKLANDVDPTVRAALACNAKLTERVRGILIDDDDKLVRETIIHTEGTAG